MGNHTVAVLHHDGWVNTDSDHTEIGRQFDMATNTSVPSNGTKEIHANGHGLATLVETHHSSESALILFQGSASTIFGKTFSRDGKENLRDEVAMMNEILKSHGLKVIHTKKP